MNSAYARGEWAQAAERARRRLKSFPDDQEGLRILARATARLGRDAAANALFARLGARALHAEDLYLIGLGLRRSGRNDDARRTWENALAVDPSHTESLEQLVGLYAQENRLLEALELAEQLACVPGRELRGELAAAGLRGELHDPAGAAATLQRALARPDAARLDPPVSRRIRKLLGRSLVRTSRVSEARAVLKSVLEEGPDAEASWLLSRAYLQTGDAEATAKALESAGPYRSEHPLESEPGPYVGEARCAACHPSQASAHQASRHVATFVRGRALAELPYPDHRIPDPAEPTVFHEFHRTGDQVWLLTEAGGKVHRAVIEYAFGAPDRYVSLLGRSEAGPLTILRLSHYRSGRDSGWTRTTGHSADAGGGRDFLGKPLDREDAIQKCLFCHATNPRAVLDRSGPEAADRAIGCERCHGPGKHHEQAVALKFPDLAIVNPKRAASLARLRLCAQCHAFHQELTLPRTDPYWIRFQGTTLTWSRCYTESAGSFDCMTCHDPHRTGARDLAAHEARCLGCHAGAPKSESFRGDSAESKRAGTSARTRSGSGTPCPVDPVGGCVRCHMPSFTSAPLHATFTDHYIRVHPELKNQSLR
jgi:tetratricopeptide (TPR) repeat protein